MRNTVLAAMLLFLCAASCKKENNREDQLPPATQTGANTFGCLVNGKVFVPKGYDGTGRPNPHVQYDIGLNGLPYFNITSDRYENDVFGGEVFISFGNISHTGNYTVPIDFNFLISWQQVIGVCGTIAFDTSIKKWGGGVITKLDLPNRIIAGTFDFKYKTTQCDTIRITDGRFDIKF